MEDLARMTRARIAPAPAAIMTASILALAAALPLRAAQNPRPTGGEGPPTDGTLGEIEERGRAIAAYLRAIERAKQVFATQGQGMADPDAIVALEDSGLWHLFYLKDASKGTQPGTPRAETMVLAQADYSPGSDEIGSLRVMIPPHAAPATPIS